MPNLLKTRLKIIKNHDVFALRFWSFEKTFLVGRGFRGGEGVVGVKVRRF